MQKVICLLVSVKMAVYSLAKGAVFVYIDHMVDAFEEVQDQYRQERLHALWQAYGNYVIGAIIFVIALTAVFSGYKYWDIKQRTADTQAFYQLIEQDDFYLRLQDADLAMRPSVKVMALMRGAGQALKDGHTDQAIALYQDVQALSGGAVYKGLATLMLARLQADQASALYTQIATDTGSIWRPFALLELAATYGAQQQYDLALNQLDQLDGLGYIPPSIRAQASALRHVFVLKQSASTS